MIELYIYITLKTLHIVAMVAWMAGLLYLPRLFVYHAECDDDPKGYERFLHMESRLYKFIMGPAMMIAVILGFALIAVITVTGFWIVVKILLVGFLIGYHVWCGRQIKNFKNNQHLPAKTYRMVNEIPIVVLLFIVFLVVAKPF